MAFVQAHLMAILSIWTVLHVIASSAAPQCPPTTWYGKALHVWVALNPLDVVKAFKAIGAEMTVPLGPAVLVLCLIAGGVSACKPAVSPEPAPLAAARQAEHDAAAALGACVIATGLHDKLMGEGVVAVTLDEIKLCWPDLGILVSAAARLHAAEQVVLATVPDAGATTITVTKAPGAP